MQLHLTADFGGQGERTSSSIPDRKNMCMARRVKTAEEKTQKEKRAGSTAFNWLFLPERKEKEKGV